MREIEFVKSHGIGNDFVIIDCLDAGSNTASLVNLAAKLCDRHFGIGGDGLLLVLPSDKADFRMRIINSDGSEAEMCGNGIRCFAKYLFDRHLAGESISVDTLAGVKTVAVISADGKGTHFTVNMGTPRLNARDIPVTGYNGQVISKPLEVDGTWFDITCVSMGNPHCVIFVDQSKDALRKLPLQSIGPRIENHPAFPRKTNVEFVQVLAEDEISVRVWERGAGETLACGTGACASLVASVLNAKTGRQVTAHLPGGDLRIDWRDDGEVFMTGPAEEVFTGRILV